MHTARAFHRASHICHGPRQSTARRRHSLSSLKQSGLPEWPSSPSPTPHEILGAVPGAPYSKAIFTQLVKLYHPDLSGADPRVSNIPESVRLERYRLVIAAHNLLSDPRSRRLYEPSKQYWCNPKNSWNSEAYRRARSYSQDHETQSSSSPSPMRQQPIYTSNATLAILLFALSMLGAALQMKRLASSRRDGKRLEVVLQEAIQEEVQAWASVLQGQSKDDRILAFLARRHGVPHQLQSWVTAHGCQS